MRVLILLALLGSALAAPRSVSRIVGGSPTTVDQYPYMANMQFGVFGIWWTPACGGSLLSTTAVLSAAHCYVGDPPSSWRAVLGSSSSSVGGAVHRASRLTLHPEYNDLTLNNDIAVIRLAMAAVFSPHVRAASIAASHYEIHDGDNVTAIGWGALSSGGSYPEQLQHVDVNVINQELCAERYADLKSQPGFSGWPDVTPGMLCAGILDAGGKDACQGDSGGPAVHDGTVAGVTSWGLGCAHPRYPGVYTRVSYYSDWITAHT